jgi:DNA polymerase/3'-5' exonuclease PolX
MQTGSFFNASLLDNNIIEGGTVEMNQILPTQTKQIDFLTSEIKLHNLYMEVDPDNDKNYIIDILASGKNKFMGIVKLNGKPARRLDILIAPVNEYYYSLLYFTGSYLFNIGIRNYVKNTFNLSLSEHGFNKPIIVNNEEDIFNYLKLKYVKPIDRNKFEI